jgi:hypothetical protein
MNNVIVYGQQSDFSQLRINNDQAAANHTVAAVVTFLIFVLSGLLIIIPAPRNPIPVTIWAAIREVKFGSTIFER